MRPSRTPLKSRRSKLNRPDQCLVVAGGGLLEPAARDRARVLCVPQEHVAGDQDGGRVRGRLSPPLGGVDNSGHLRALGSHAFRHPLVAPVLVDGEPLTTGRHGEIAGHQLRRTLGCRLPSDAFNLGDALVDLAVEIIGQTRFPTWRWLCAVTDGLRGCRPWK